MSLLLLILISFSHKVIGINVQLVPDEKCNEKSYVTSCIYEIYDLHQTFYKLTVVIYTNKEEENIPDDIFTEGISFVKTENLNDLNEISDIYEGTVLILVYLKSCNDLTDMEIIPFDTKFRYIIILDTFLDKKCYDEVKTILFEYKTYNLVFVVADTESAGKYNFVTAIPDIDAVTCIVAKLVTMKITNVCQNSTLDKKNVNDIFPPKDPTDLKMCNFNVGIATLYPYGMVSHEETLKDLDTSGDLHGMDVEIMKIIANKINSTLKLFHIHRYNRSYTFQNILPYFWNETLDAVAGGIYRVYGDNVTYSGVYSRQFIFWVFTIERDRRSWQSLVVKMTGLYVFFITYLGYVILWNLFNRFDYQNVGIIDTLIYGWGAMAGAASLQDARSLKHKILNIMYLTMCLHLSAYVSTQIYYYLTVERPPHYFKTTDEIISSDRKPFLMLSSKFFVDDNKHTAYVNKSLDCFNFTHCEELMVKHKTSTILVEGLLPILQAITSVNDEASVMRVPEDILVVYHEMVMRKNSPVVKIFQKIVQSLFETGICQKAYDEAIGITVVDKAKIANKNILSNSYSCTLGCEITLTQSAVAFYLWIFGCCFSCCIFIIELLIECSHSVTTFDRLST